MAHITFATYCAEKGAQLFRSGEEIRGFPYIFAAIELSAAEDRAALIDSAAAELFKKCKASQASNDQDSTRLYDDLIRCISTSDQNRLSISEAAWRADRRREDGLQAWRNDELEIAATHLIAAAALSPSCSKTRQARAQIARSFSTRTGNADFVDLTETQVLDLGIAVAVGGGTEDALRLADWLYWKMDFETAMRLSRRAGDEANNAGFSFRAEFLALKSKYRLDGASITEAEKRSAEKIVRTLLQYGPASGLTDELLLIRSNFCFLTGNLSIVRADLSEIMRRKTVGAGNLTIAAANALVVTRNALNWDFREAIKILENLEFETPFSLIDLFHWAWSGGEMDAVLRLVEKISQHRPCYSIMPILHAMAIDLALQPIKTIGYARQGSFKIYANVGCWGDEHTDLMERAMLASLLSPGNLPALGQTASLYFDVFTMPSEIERLANSPRIRKLAEHCEVRLFAFPSTIEPFKTQLPHMMLGFAQHSTVLRAEADGADYMQFYPDAVYADGCYATIARHLTRAPLVMLADSLNVYSEPLLNALRDNAIIDGALIATPTQLLDAVSGKLTRRSLDQLYQCDDSKGSESPVRAIFELPDGLAMHSLFANPIYISHAALTPLPVMNFAVTDGFFIEHLLEIKGEDQLKILTSPEYLSVEICKDDGSVFNLTKGTLATRIKKMIIDMATVVTRKRIFEHRNFFANVKANGNQITTVEEADRVVSDILDMFETDQALSDLQRERWEIEQAYRDARENLSVASLSNG